MLTFRPPLLPALAVAAILAGSVPAADRSQPAPAGPLDQVQIALYGVQAGANLSLASIGRPGLRTSRYLHLTWHIHSPSPGRISVLGEPLLLEAVAQGGRDLLTTSHVRTNPWEARPPVFVGATGHNPITISAGVSFEHDGPMPAAIERLAADIDVAALGEVAQFALPATPNEEFTAACEGVKVRVAATGAIATGGAEPHARCVVIEYRLGPPTALEAHTSAEAERALTPPIGRPKFGDQAVLAGTYRAPMLVSAVAVSDEGSPVSYVGQNAEVPTTTGRFGTLVVIHAAAAPVQAIRLEVCPAAEVRRYRLTARGINTGG